MDSCLQLPKSLPSTSGAYKVLLAQHLLNKQVLPGLWNAGKLLRKGHGLVWVFCCSHLSSVFEDRKLIN